MDEILNLNPISKLLHDVYSGSIAPDLEENYFPEVSHVTKWLCVSDYCLDRNKHNDVLSFSFIPHVFDTYDLLNLIKRISPKEAKKTRKINTKFLDFLKYSPILNFSIIIENHKKLLSSERSVMVESLIYTFTELYNTITKIKHPNKAIEQYYLSIQQKIKLVIFELRNNKKVRLIKNLLLIIATGSYLSSMIANRTKSKIFAWFSDRDAVNDIAKNISMDLFHILFSEMLIDKDCQFFSTPSSSKDEEWYNEVIKIPDLFSGIFSSINLDNLHVDHDKYMIPVERLVKDNNRNVFIIKLNFNDQMGSTGTGSRIHIQSKVE